MSATLKTFLLLEVYQRPEDVPFEGPLSTLLRSIKPESGVLHVMDNFSDSLMVRYTTELIDQSEEVVVICDLKATNSPGAVLAVLNYCVKKSGISLFTLGSNKGIDPFLKMMKGQAFVTEEALVSALKWQIAQD